MLTELVVEVADAFLFLTNQTTSVIFVFHVLLGHWDLDPGLFFFLCYRYCFVPISTFPLSLNSFALPPPRRRSRWSRCSLWWAVVRRSSVPLPRRLTSSRG